MLSPWSPCKSYAWDPWQTLLKCSLWLVRPSSSSSSSSRERRGRKGDPREEGRVSSRALSSALGFPYITLYGGVLLYAQRSRRNLLRARSTVDAVEKPTGTTDTSQDFLANSSLVSFAGQHPNHRMHWIPRRLPRHFPLHHQQGEAYPLPRVRMW